MITGREKERPNYIAEIMETLSGSLKSTSEEKVLAINLNEYVFFRICLVAWNLCSNDTMIMNRSQM